MLALGMFGIGTIAGMMLVTLLLALPAMYAMSRFAGAQRPITIASGVASVAFGLLLAHRVGFVEGLFRFGSL
jgi:high-affinity nickel-transport protein